MKTTSIFVNDKKFLYSSKMVLIDFLLLKSHMALPRFCYHEKLSVAGNCRMCLVEDSKSVKPVIACSTLLSDGLSVYTNTIKVKRAREGIIEFLLANHPLDCPICDQGGECDLQDITMIFGSDRGRFYDFKRSVADKNCGPFIKTVMNRCIHCTRCVRFAHEIMGFSSLGISGRGSRMEISTYVERFILNEFSGNSVDLCPVGALTSKPYAFKGRPWELTPLRSIAPFNLDYSAVRMDVRGTSIMRVQPRSYDLRGEDWIVDDVRYFYDSLSKRRLLKPHISMYLGRRVRLGWKRVFNYIKYYYFNVLKLLSRERYKLFPVISDFGAFSDLAVLNTCSDYARSFGNFVGMSGVSNFMPHTNQNFLFKEADLNSIKILILVGLNLRLSAPLLNLKIRRLVQKNHLILYFIGVYNYMFHRVIQLSTTHAFVNTLVKGKHWVINLLQREPNLLIFGNPVINYSFYFSNLSLLNVRYFWANASCFSKNMLGLVFSRNILNYSSASKIYFRHFFEGLDYSSFFDTLFVRSKKNLTIFVGSNFDFSVSLSNLTLPVANLFERKISYVRISGERVHSAPIFGMLHQVRTLPSLIKSLFRFLTLPSVISKRVAAPLVAPYNSAKASICVIISPYLGQKVMLSTNLLGNMRDIFNFSNALFVNSNNLTLNYKSCLALSRYNLYERSVVYNILR